MSKWSEYGNGNGLPKDKPRTGSPQKLPRDEAQKLPRKDATTQEQSGAPHPLHQKCITLNGESVWVDPELIPLLKALNKAGLVTRSHCAGHSPESPAWIAIRMDNVSGLEIRNDGTYNEVLIKWTPTW